MTSSMTSAITSVVTVVSSSGSLCTSRSISKKILFGICQHDAAVYKEAPQVIVIPLGPISCLTQGRHSVDGHPHHDQHPDEHHGAKHSARLTSGFG